MWNRSLFKANAKNVLKRSYWVPFGVSLVSLILTGGFSGFNFNFNNNSFNNTNPSKETQPSGNIDFSEIFSKISWNEIALIGGILLIVFLIFFVMGISYSLFVSNPILVGTNRFYMENRDIPVKFSTMFYTFKVLRYIKTVKTMFFMQLYLFFWSLLAIVPIILLTVQVLIDFERVRDNPGIILLFVLFSLVLSVPSYIKTYEYRMIPYIMSENPNISTKRAFELSKMMTKNQKWDLFVLDLSFIGWFLLGILACFIGTLFLLPYIAATNAEVYQYMREKALTMGFSNDSELTGFNVIQQSQ